MDKRLLIIDDESSILTMLDTFFTESTDYTVKTVSSGEEAMEVLREKRYPIIITDLKMPGMSGMELCKLIRESNPLSYIIAMTGYQDFFELKNCRAVGFDDYFKKPFEFQDLLEAVDDTHKKMSRWDTLLSE